MKEAFVRQQMWRVYDEYWHAHTYTSIRLTSKKFISASVFSLSISITIRKFINLPIIWYVCIFLCCISSSSSSWLENIRYFPFGNSPNFDVTVTTIANLIPCTSTTRVTYKHEWCLVHFVRDAINFFHFLPLFPL